MIRILYMNVNMLKDADLYQKGMNMVSSERKEKINQIKNPMPARLSLGAGILLRIALEEKGYAHLIEDICYGKNGKPFLKDVDFHFNLSHSGNVCICAVSDKEVGCDVEKLGKANMKVAKRFFSPEEFKALENADESEKDDLFFRIWTMKESFIKAVGTGLGMALDSFSVDITKDAPFISYSTDKRAFQLKEYNLLDGYKISLCALDGNFAEAVEVTET